MVLGLEFVVHSGRFTPRPRPKIAFASYHTLCEPGFFFRRFNIPRILSRLTNFLALFLRILNCSVFPDFLAWSLDAMVANVSRFRLILGLSGLNFMDFKCKMTDSLSTQLLRQLF